MHSNLVLFQKDPQLIAYKKALINELNELAFILFDDGFKKGYSRSIEEILRSIREINKNYAEYEDVHNKIIETNARYQSLYETFPGWQNVNHIVKSIKLLNNMEVTYSQYHPECKIM